MLKIVQAAQPPLPPLPPPPPPPPPISLGVKEIPKVRGSKVKVKVLNNIYTREIPKYTWKYTNVVSTTARINKAASIRL